MLGQKPVQLIRKCLAVALVERRRAARVHTAAAQSVHEIAHRQPLLDRVFGIELPARIQRMAAPRDYLGGQRNIGGDYQVANLNQSGDLVIRHIETRRHLYRPDDLRRRAIQQLVRYQRQLDMPPLRRTKQDFLDDLRTRVGVYPNLHIYRFS